MSTITTEQQTAIADKLKDMHLPSGLGDAESACSIAAINLALTGNLTDEIPECMSAVIGRWIIQVQDGMPDAMRNSEQWKSLLPLAAGTGRAHEQERLEIVLNWMWNRVLPVFQLRADKHGFGREWQHMCTERTVKSAVVAKDAAYASAAVANAAANAANATASAAVANAAYASAAVANATANAAAYAAYAANATAYAADAADAADANAAANAAAANAAANAARYAAAAIKLADAADAAAWDAAAWDAAWEAMDPCSVLELLISKGK